MKLELNDEHPSWETNEQRRFAQLNPTRIPLLSHSTISSAP
jgi:hypothetical protein